MACLNWQTDAKLSALPRLRLHLQATTMFVYHNLTGNRQSQTCAFTHTPELNPMEYLNNVVKQAVHGQAPTRNLEQLKRRLRSQLHRLQKLPEQIRNYYFGTKTECLDLDRVTVSLPFPKPTRA